MHAAQGACGLSIVLVMNHGLTQYELVEFGDASASARAAMVLVFVPRTLAKRLFSWWTISTVTNRLPTSTLTVTSPAAMASPTMLFVRAAWVACDVAVAGCG